MNCRLTILEEVHSIPRGVTQGDQGRVQAEREELGHVFLSGSMGGVLWGSLAKAQSIQTKVSRVLVSSAEVLSKGHIRGKTLDVGATVDHKAW